ncbi:uncharacterized protein K489DRAFT_90747 [Dissoconium aciculare CBS 342.82]|uniref:Uncharacterized protein n=1 Tax=Dissoconium aciculare CBS 342.82 TaxID=1314786 RepID=A0A6J3LV71_9PEZI|nr:uncharacterized protein K489DRAFT_90747 [Dissoconium aciculare CBS 342.82]KAF1818527.1 hypothetical protein K489DRAFT_90747 [Dissoconium aciculare CBS 342.82]
MVPYFSRSFCSLFLRYILCIFRDRLDHLPGATASTSKTRQQAVRPSHISTCVYHRHTRLTANYRHLQHFPSRTSPHQSLIYPQISCLFHSGHPQGEKFPCSWLVNLSVRWPSGYGASFRLRTKNSAEDKITSGAIFVGSSPTLIKFLPLPFDI